jgi:hypothetical protein
VGAPALVRDNAVMKERRRALDGSAPSGRLQESIMDFRICGLPYEPFAPLFEMSESELHEHGSVRRVAYPGSTYPCRVSLDHAVPGEIVILTNYVHLADPASPYRSLGPIFVRRDPGETFDRVNEVPPVLRARPLSLRAYDHRNMIVAAQVTDGDGLPAAIDRLFANDNVGEVHVHHAAYGCYQCRVVRA